jgi:hypothetical protein
MMMRRTVTRLKRRHLLLGKAGTQPPVGAFLWTQRETDKSLAGWGSPDFVRLLKAARKLK